MRAYPLVLVLGLIAERCPACACCGAPSGYGGPTLGDPVVELAEPPDADAITASQPNPCEIDLDFGDVEVGKTATVPIQILNAGAGELDLSAIDASRYGDFAITYSVPGPIYSGEFYGFSATFEPSDAGQDGATFVIDTNGQNTECPADGYEILMVMGGSGR